MFVFSTFQFGANGVSVLTVCAMFADQPHDSLWHAARAQHP